MRSTPMESAGQDMRSARRSTLGWVRKAMVCAVAFVGFAAVPAMGQAADPNQPENFQPHKRARITQEELGRLRMLEIQSGAFREAHKDPGSQQLVGPPLSDREKVMHVMNRLAFGPKQGDVEKVLF